MTSRNISLAVVVAVGLFSLVIPVTNGISIPWFGSFGSSRQQAPVLYNEQKEPRIINADHVGSSGDGTSATASLAGGSFVGPSPWISGTRDQFIRDQLVLLHPDSALNRDAWKESGYLNAESDASKDIRGPSGMVPSARTPPARVRKPTRKSKQQTTATKTVSEEDSSGPPKQNTNNVISLSPSQTTGGLYEFLPTPLAFYRDLNQNGELTPIDDDYASIINQEPIFLPANNFLYPLTAPIFPYSPRAIASHSTLPPEAVIQLLKSPEQELSPLSRPQVKLPFPLSHDCSANNGGSGSKPLQFVVLPIVEPVAPLKPIFPKPSFLSSQYGQFPYIPPFNLFNKKPPVYPTSNLDGSTSNGINQVGGGASGQFVPILNRPAPPLPFVFVQSLPLELIGHNVEMDVLNSSPSQTSESKINEVSPIAAPSPTLPTPSQPSTIASASIPIENISSASRPLPLIVIEKVKTPGQPPSSPVAPAAAVVEISKQSIPKSGAGSGSSPLSTISVVKPITAPGSEPQTLQQQQEIQKAIEKLVPVAAAVLENVEQQQKKQKDDKDQAPAPPVPVVTSNERGAVISSTTESVGVIKQNESEKAVSLRPPLRPDSVKESAVPQKVAQGNTEPMMSSTSDEIAGIGVNPTAMSDVEIMEA